MAGDDQEGEGEVEAASFLWSLHLPLLTAIQKQIVPHRLSLKQLCSWADA